MAQVHYGRGYVYSIQNTEEQIRNYINSQKER